MKNLNDIILPIAAELQQFEAFFEQTLKAETEPMNSIMRYVSDTRGKRLRPILVLLGAKLFGEVNGQTLRAATFVEMVHSATLIHDDVVDDSDQRRSKASVKAQFGNLSAVLAGDYLLAKAMLLLSHPDDYAILQEMLRTTAAMSEGELMQNIVTDCVPQLEKTTKYLDIITRKTARLMRSCCAAGAMSVEATPEQVQHIADFGLNFGILFQLRDDMLDSENTEQAKVLLPEYLQKTLGTLKHFPESETLEALRNLTVFCAERKE
ncbi:MAG: polyprenyl synthetase family protein [Bacteroidales bacterium]|nr:polyprenyl synthetase family protein [Bacteroidales bacterium]MBR6929685.1 polyprenyl synthetase family protein [Bacteroidales bacterium]